MKRLRKQQQSQGGSLAHGLGGVRAGGPVTPFGGAGGTSSHLPPIGPDSDGQQWGGSPKYGGPSPKYAASSPNGKQVLHYGLLCAVCCTTHHLSLSHTRTTVEPCCPVFSGGEEVACRQTSAGWHA